MADQAQRLRELVWRSNSQARVIAVTSGKGGVGKTSTSVNLSIALAAQGRRVILLDADLGLANVEVLMGFSARYNLQDVIDGRLDVSDVLYKAPGGIEVVPGTSGLARMADLNEAARENVIRGLEHLEAQADFIIIDTMAGIGQNAVAFNIAADEVLLVTTPEPSAIVDAYAMLKTISMHRADAVIRLVVNMVGNEAQGKAVSAKLARVCQEYLGRNLSTLGYIPRDPHVSQAVMQSYPFTLKYPNSPAAQCVGALAQRLLRQQLDSEPQKDGFLKRFAQSIGLAS